MAENRGDSPISSDDEEAEISSEESTSELKTLPITEQLNDSRKSSIQEDEVVESEEDFQEESSNVIPMDETNSPLEAVPASVLEIGIVPQNAKVQIVEIVASEETKNIEDELEIEAPFDEPQSLVESISSLSLEIENDAKIASVEEVEIVASSEDIIIKEEIAVPLIDQSQCLLEAVSASVLEIGNGPQKASIQEVEIIDSREEEDDQPIPTPCLETSNKPQNSSQQKSNIADEDNEKDATVEVKLPAEIKVNESFSAQSLVMLPEQPVISHNEEDVALMGEKSVATATNNTDLPINGMVSRSTNVPQEQNVTCKKVGKIEPEYEINRDSEVHKLINEEVLKTVTDLKQENRPRSTFLQQPNRPKVKPKNIKLAKHEEVYMERYKIPIIKQPKPKITPDNFQPMPIPRHVLEFLSSQKLLSQTGTTPAAVKEEPRAKPQPQPTGIVEDHIRPDDGTTPMAIEKCEPSKTILMSCPRYLSSIPNQIRNLTQDELKVYNEERTLKEKELRILKIKQWNSMWPWLDKKQGKDYRINFMKNASPTESAVYRLAHSLGELPQEVQTEHMQPGIIPTIPNILQV